MKFTSLLKLKLIYVFRINDAAHKGCLKVGEATCENDNVFNLAPNSKILNESAKKRINQYTQTAGIAYDLLYTELTIYTNKGTLCSFNDKEVHSVLERSGIKKKIFDTENKANEWFITDLETVKKAITAVKEGKKSLSSSDITFDKTPIVFRPEQREAIDKTITQFKKGDQMLWNAKMRFGKTLSALQVVKEMEFGRTLILTHRPVVDKGWFEDFGKIFYDRSDFAYGSKNNGDNHFSLEQRSKMKKSKYIYFASMQDLRGSELVGGNFDKNNEIFATLWDFIIVDEAHEGTQTELGKAVMQELTKDKATKVLRLSGTPFNLFDDFKEDEIYTWDYVMEQRAKANWDVIHQGDPNPYATLPAMNIYTYDLGRLLNEYMDEDVAFNFREFFRVNDNGTFIHEKDVKAFLNLITKNDEESCYPFANERYRNIFRHTLWMIPGVKEAKALSTLLQGHPVFQHFKIVNVAGDGDQDEESKDALEAVENAIGNDPDATRSITLSCGRLTTGVSVKAWTGVFMLSGSYNTAASGYMQTIFRVQTPATINGRVKEECYVFDFAPDRTLKVIAETAKISAKAGKTSSDDRKIMGEFLNFCPVIAIDGSKMEKFDVPKMLEQLKRVYVDRVVRNGFEDKSLYNDELMKLNDLELQEFDDLKKIIGQTKAMPKTSQIDINNQGLTDEQYEELENLEKKNKNKGKEKQPLTEEEKKRLEELKKKKDNREAAISILRGISIRMPLLIYGAEVNNEEEITIDNFSSLIDEQSWEEFMPKGVSKSKFESIKKYYDPEIFSAAGKRIRTIARAADKLSIEERIERISDIFSTFRNPDKETVLTPWRVVNMHLGDCLGGYNFYDINFEKTISEPRFIDRGDITTDVFSPESRVLEINSKSGLYPLYVAYNIYRARVASSLFPIQSINDELTIWDKVIAENIYVICKTPMAKSITKRTLAGFRKAKVNTRHFNDLINQIKNKPEHFVAKVARGCSYWKAIKNDNMKFNAIVGNPPYQEMDGGSGVSARPVYNKFVEVSKQINPHYISIIMPSRWFIGGKGLDDFRETMLNDKHIRKLFDFETSNDIFPGVDIAGGVCYLLWDASYNGKCAVTNSINKERHTKERDLSEFEVFIRRAQAVEIIKKISSYNENNGKTLSERVSARKPFGMATNYKPRENGIPCQFIQRIGLKYANPENVKDDFNLLNKWKLLLPIAPIAGQTDFTKPVGFYYDGNVFISKPGECCTESFIVACAFDTEAEVLSFKSYLFTKIVRYLLLQSVISQHVSKQNFQFVPDLEIYNEIFTDEILRQRWNINDDEWNVIDERIKQI